MCFVLCNKLLLIYVVLVDRKKALVSNNLSMVSVQTDRIGYTIIRAGTRPNRFVRLVAVCVS